MEYPPEILQALRPAIRFRGLADDWPEVPKDVDARDTAAGKRLAAGYSQPLFPHAIHPGAVSVADFDRYRLQPARRLRRISRKPLHIPASEYPPALPEIVCRPIDQLRGRRP